MFTNKEKLIFKDWVSELKSKDRIKSQYIKQSERELWVKNNPCPISEKIKNYYEEGYGYKILCRELGVSYTFFRGYIRKYTDINYRIGKNVVTDKLREIRSNNIKGEKSPFYDWPNKKPYLFESVGKSIQGYYHKKDSSFVWLRSTYEYIFAKWLDKQKIDWNIEEKAFDLSNGEKYRPDFFVYNNDKLCAIVEVKSTYFYSNRLYKFELFKNEYPIKCFVVTDIEKYTNKGYHKELKEWKEKRIPSKEKLNLKD